MVTASRRVVMQLQALRRGDRESMNLKRFTRYRPSWNWKAMVGSAACVKWCFRDLENLDAALRLFSERRVAVQAGGNVGIFPKRLAEEFTRVLTFEPDRTLYKALTVNAPEENIEAHCLGLGDTPRRVGLSGARRDTSGRAAHEGLTHVVDGDDVRLVTLDSFALPHCDLLYLDVEGYELFAMQGAEETIQRCRPVVGVEINRNAGYYGIHPESVRGFLTSRGYVQALVRNSDEVFVPQEKLK